jgi:hypothetical protein
MSSATAIRRSSDSTDIGGILLPRYHFQACKFQNTLLAARRVSRSDFRNLGLLSLVLLHVNAVLLRSGLGLLIGRAGFRTNGKFVV